MWLSRRSGFGFEARFGGVVEGPLGLRLLEAGRRKKTDGAMEPVGVTRVEASDRAPAPHTPLRR